MAQECGALSAYGAQCSAPGMGHQQCWIGTSGRPSRSPMLSSSSGTTTAGGSRPASWSAIAEQGWFRLSPSRAALAFARAVSGGDAPGDFAVHAEPETVGSYAGAIDDKHVGALQCLGEVGASDAIQQRYEVSHRGIGSPGPEAVSPKAAATAGPGKGHLAGQPAQVDN